MREYKIAKGWALFIYLTAPLIIGLFGWLLILILFQNKNWILLPFSIGLITLMVVCLIDTYKRKLIIDSEKITSISTFSAKALKLDEIKGYTINEKYINVEPKDKSKKRIKISAYIGKNQEIIIWIAERYPDLKEVTALEKN